MHGCHRSPIGTVWGNYHRRDFFRRNCFGTVLNNVINTVVRGIQSMLPSGIKFWKPELPEMPSLSLILCFMSQREFFIYFLVFVIKPVRLPLLCHKIWPPSRFLNPNPEPSPYQNFSQAWSYMAVDGVHVQVSIPEMGSGTVYIRVLIREGKNSK